MLDECYLDRFENAWLSGTYPDLRETVDTLTSTSATTIPRRLLEELVMIDIECRWRAHADLTNANLTNDASETPPAPHKVEQYQADFPELGAIPELSVTLIAEEYHARQRWGDQPSAKEYQKRFPHQWPRLRARLDTMAQDIVQATVSIWHLQKLIHVTRLPAWLEIGRQAKNEPQPCHEMTTSLGHRLIIAPITARYLSRKHLICEPSGKEHVRLTCISKKNSIILADTEILPDESQRVPLPLVWNFHEWQVRVATA